MSKKVKCCECDSFMGWALPRGVDKDNYEYAKEVLKLASTTGICEYTMKTKARSHEQYCRKFKKDKFLERHNDFFKDEILKLENMIKEYEKENFVEVDESWKAHFMRRFQEVKQMERLTERYVPNDEKKGIAGIKVFESEDKIPLVKVLSGEYLYPAIEKLADYEDLEEQGLLMKLPVPLGTTVYTLSTIFDCIYDYDCKSDQKWKCKEDIPCEYEKRSYHIKETEFGFVMAHSIGETVFLTREEAEKKLVEMKK